MTFLSPKSGPNPDPALTPSDRHWMQRCLDLALQAQGHTEPNPMVGSVIVQPGGNGQDPSDDRLLGQGFHPAAGQPHAEVFALREAGGEAGEAARGATLYVNLEPCNHYGRTPPCSEAIVAAGIARVVVGMVDPNPLVAGTGLARLRSAGIAVTVGVLEAECQRLNEAFVHRIRHQRPFGILKYAMTLDGKIATTTGHSAWVTGPAARARVHALRSTCGAVIVGGNTVRLDNPHLTSHGGGRNPLRVVLSRGLDLPAQAHLWETQVAPTLVVTEASGSGKTLGHQGLHRRQLEDLGVEVVELETLTPDGVARLLYDRGLASILWECGGVLGARAIAAGSVQKVWAFIAPKLIGGTGASPVGELGLRAMTEALVLERVRVEAIGPDWLVEGYFPESLPENLPENS